jgi:histidinol-phosphatase
VDRARLAEARGMTDFDLDRVGGRKALDALVDVVLAAGEEALRIQREGLRIEIKGDRSPVTQADEAVELRLRAHVTKTWPEAAFLGEETGTTEGGALRVIVDPVDGTRAFMRGLDTWSVLVGLEWEKEPVVGLAFLPAAGDLFIGVRGGGAYVNGRPCRLSRVAALDEALVGHGGLEQFTAAGLEGLLPRLARGTYTQRGLADFANYAALLRGSMDAVVDPGVKPFDIAPAAVLVREAGGCFTDFAGKETIYGGAGLASNGRLHDELLALVVG